MSEFDRRLSDVAKHTLMQLISDESSSWWRDLLTLWAPSGREGDLRLAIRNGYMNFYSCGQSIARINFLRDGTPRLHIHHKYVIARCEGSQRYLRFLPHEGSNAQGEHLPWGGLEMLREWIERSKKYRGKEKPEVERAVAAMPAVIDLEMGLPAFGDQKSALRMDMVAIERVAEDFQIVFWEAKRIGDGRLRSKTEPRVFEQVDAYKRFLDKDGNRMRVIEAYRRACQLLRDFNLVAQRHCDAPPLNDLILEAARDNSPIEVAPTPRLLVFDDGAKRNGTAWQRHLDRLRERVHVTVVAPHPVADSSA